MGKINAEGMLTIGREISARRKMLHDLTSKDFNLNDPNQMAIVRNYINHFEYWVHQMYLFQGLKSALKAGGGGWISGFILPIPQFANYFLTMVLYFGLAGMILEHFSIKEFHMRLSEMKTIYNWCIKNNNWIYDGRTDNSEKLAHPDLQRLIQLLSPLCPTDFLLAWPEVTGDQSALSKAAYIVTAANTLFFSPTKPGINQDELKKLKKAVEMREFDVGSYRGFENAIRYFTTNEHFKEILLQSMQFPIAYAKELLPEAVIHSMSRK